MAMDANARLPVPVAPAGADDYETLMAVLSASARGRAFLAEHARRNRQADTEAILAALRKLEQRLTAQELAPTPRPPAEPARPHLALVHPAQEPEHPIPPPAPTKDEAALLTAADPLAALMALSADERLALFS
jgi:hypothetical protein